MFDPRRGVVASLLPLMALACGESNEPADDDSAATGGLSASSPSAGGSRGLGATSTTGGVVTSGSGGVGAAAGTGASPATGAAPGTGAVSGSGGVTPTGGVPGTGGVPETGGVPATGGAASTGGVPSTGGLENTGGIPEPLTCAEAVGPYAISGTPLDSSLAPGDASGGWGAENFAYLPVAVDSASGQVFVGFTSADSAATIASTDGVIATTPGAHLGGVAVTSNGVAALLFDPNSNVDERTWAAVARYDNNGGVIFETDLFRSPNLEDEGTKGAPGASRFGYLPGSDELVAYFGHTQRYDDGVRHQGGYLATIDAAGNQNLLDGWFGSHNLDQRLLVQGSAPAVLGLSDAYPQGIFFSFLDDNPRTNVIYPLAAAGNGPPTDSSVRCVIDHDGTICQPKTLLDPNFADLWRRHRAPS